MRADDVSGSLSGPFGGRLLVRPFRGETACQALSGGDCRGRRGAIGGIFWDPRWLGQNGNRLCGAREGLDWSGCVPAFLCLSCLHTFPRLLNKLNLNKFMNMFMNKLNLNKFRSSS